MRKAQLMYAAILWSAAALRLGGVSSDVRGADGPRETVQLSEGWRFQLDIADVGEREGWYRRDFDRSRGPGRCNGSSSGA